MQAPETATSVKIVPLEQQTQVLVCIARDDGVKYDIHTCGNFCGC